MNTKGSIGKIDGVEENMIKILHHVDLDSYFSYQGSLTTPPCSQAVNWMVFTSPLQMSHQFVSQQCHAHFLEPILCLVEYVRYPVLFLSCVQFFCK